MIDKLERATHKLRNDIRQLHRASVRAERGEFLVEGPHACHELLLAGARPAVMVVSSDVGEENLSIIDLALRANGQVCVASPAEVERLCTTPTSQGIVMVMPMFEERACRDRIVALDRVADPGNVGTIIRTAAWFGCTDVVVTDGSADVYNPKVVRASAGALAAVNIIRRSSVLEFMDEHQNVQIIVADVDSGLAPSSVTTSTSWCLVVGSEAHGVSSEVRAQAALRVSIPGHSAAVESLNAAVATAILLYELTGAR